MYVDELGIAAMLIGSFAGLITYTLLSVFETPSTEKHRQWAQSYGIDHLFQ